MASATECNGNSNTSLLTVIARGKDRPGIADAFLKVTVSHKCELRDLAQFMIEGMLVFTFVLEVADQSSLKLIRDMKKCAKDHGMEVEYDFPEGTRDEVDESMALLSLVSTSGITPALLHGLDSALAKHGCVVHEIEHRSDNKIENNNECSKMQLRVRCPKGLGLGTLYLGARNPDGEEVLGLQNIIKEDHGVQVTLRWWDAMSRPNGKSLVVFGLSDVLCPYDVLDELLKEAGVDPSACSSASASGNLVQQRQSKVSLLKGKSADCVPKLLQRLKLTHGARLVCSALKALGCTLAILTNTGVGSVAKHVQQQLGLDYVICQDLEVADGSFTGQYAGEAKDVKFRKLDLLKLMADREGIEYRNVIVVGEVLKGLKLANARDLLETFGPNVYFNAQKNKDLALALYLLGFNASHVQALRKRYTSHPAEVPRDSSPSLPKVACGKPVKSLLLQIMAHTQGPGHIRNVMAPLLPLSKECCLHTARLCSLESGGMCLGLDMRAACDNSDQLLKDLLFSCQKSGLEVKWDETESGAEAVPSWESGYRNRYVITMVQKPNISGSTIEAFFAVLSENGVNCMKIERLSVKEMAAMQLTVVLPENFECNVLSAKLLQVSKEHGADIAFQADDIDRWMRRLVVFDMDSTLIQQEVIDELAKIAGVETQVATITEAAMRGEIDFFESLKARVALLKGHKAEELFDSVKQNLIFTPGAERLCTTLKKMGYKMAVISGGFLPVAREVQRHLGLDYAFANNLEVDEHTGLLTGNVLGQVVTPQRKRALLATIANVEGCEVQQTIAVGDGSNDIPMLNTAGLGIAFCAKPKVQAATEFHINQKDLSTVVFLIGLSEHAALRLAPQAGLDADHVSKRQRVS
mmetsp:Transcript_25341/g.58901  ORF Transcript_25341/g.58901 Transcript_25341/m.58901 type:complete len:866 (+) Transcript_25341:37-2634(+)